MKSTGIVRKTDSLGRVVIPKEIRDVLGIGTEDSIEIFTDADSVVLRKYIRGCNCCSNEATVHVYGVGLCESCLYEFNKASKKAIKLNQET